jgi:MFS family permease
MRVGPVAVTTVTGNGSLMRVVAAYALFVASEYAVWIAVLVFAFDRGGARSAGLVALAQLVPAAVAAPLVATLADRHPPTTLLRLGLALQGLATVGTALAIWAGQAHLAYAAAVFASTLVTTTRPAQAALLPALARSVDELTAANVVIGWVESAGIVAAGLGIGLLLGAFDVGSAVLAAGLAALAAAALVTGLRTHPIGVAAQATPRDQLAEGARLLMHSRRARLLVALLSAEGVVAGALDVFFVVLAIAVLDQSQAWAGYLNTFYGIGGLLAGPVAMTLVGRKLGRPILLSGGVLAAGLLAAAFAPGLPTTVLAVLAIGVGRSVFDVATRALLQRSVPANVIGRVFGLVEGLWMAGLGLGSVLVPLLVSFAGNRGALLGVSLVLPLVGLVGWRPLRRLDSAVTVPVVEIALLRSLRLFRDLPAPTLEGLAASLQRVPLEPGAVVIREGDAGDHYYVIADGSLAISRHGRPLGVRGRGDGVGEIALLNNIARTATVTVTVPTVLYALERDDFLGAVSRHPNTSRTASAIAGERLVDHDPEFQSDD